MSNIKMWRVLLLALVLPVEGGKGSTLRKVHKWKFVPRMLGIGADGQLLEGLELEKGVNGNEDRIKAVVLEHGLPTRVFLTLPKSTFQPFPFKFLRMDFGKQSEYSPADKQKRLEWEERATATSYKFPCFYQHSEMLRDKCYKTLLPALLVNFVIVMKIIDVTEPYYALAMVGAFWYVSKRAVQCSELIHQAHALDQHWKEAVLTNSRQAWMEGASSVFASSSTLISLCMWWDPVAAYHYHKLGPQMGNMVVSILFACVQSKAISTHQ